MRNELGMCEASANELRTRVASRMRRERQRAPRVQGYPATCLQHAASCPGPGAGQRRRPLSGLGTQCPRPGAAREALAADGALPTLSGAGLTDVTVPCLAGGPACRPPARGPWAVGGCCWGRVGTSLASPAPGPRRGREGHVARDRFFGTETGAVANREWHLLEDGLSLWAPP